MTAGVATQARMVSHNMAFSLLKRLLGIPSGDAARGLLSTLIAEGRDPAWYRDAAVPDTVDGRFEAMALVTALALIRIEAFGEAGADLFRNLSESFAADMEIQVREIGLGEGVMAKHVGRMMNLLGGRISGLKAAGDDDAALAEWLGRTLHKQSDPAPAAPQTTAAVARIRTLEARLRQTALIDLSTGQISA